MVLLSVRVDWSLVVQQVEGAHADAANLFADGHGRLDGEGIAIVWWVLVEAKGLHVPEFKFNMRFDFEKKTAPGTGTWWVFLWNRPEGESAADRFQRFQLQRRQVVGALDEQQVERRNGLELNNGLRATAQTLAARCLQFGRPAASASQDRPVDGRMNKKVKFSPLIFFRDQIRLKPRKTRHT